MNTQNQLYPTQPLDPDCNESLGYTGMDELEDEDDNSDSDIEVWKRDFLLP